MEVKRKKNWQALTGGGEERRKEDEWCPLGKVSSTTSEKPT